MGQLALGLRSLLVKAAIFFLLAAALAWALGGTLFPRPARILFPGVEFSGALWQVRLSVGGEHPGEAWYELVRSSPGERLEVVGGEYAEVSGPVVAGDTLVLAVRQRDSEGGRWVLRHVGADRAEREEQLPDRLAVEEALAALRGGAAR
jgi:hypothetical protein